MNKVRILIVEDDADHGRSLLEAELLKKCLSEESARADGGRARRTGTAVVPGDDLEDRRQVSTIHRREPP